MVSTRTTPLGLDPDTLVACVSCGLCLPHCPTYRATSEETASPRGRIALMRAVESGSAPIDDAFEAFMDRCVVCRGCETACPSGVHFDELMEGTRIALAKRRPGRVPRWLRVGLAGLGHHRLVLAGSTALAIAQRLRLVPPALATKVGLPLTPLPLRRRRLRPGARSADTADAWLFTGCVMDAWQRPVHEAALRVMHDTGAKVALGGDGSACCGALHAHAGVHDGAVAFARRVMTAFPGDAPIVVDSAGCGAALKDYGSLLGTPEAAAFSARVLDLGEWLAPRLDRLPTPAAVDRYPSTVAISDPCHLRHVQKAHLPWRAVLSFVADTIELDDEGRCCGAGGAYSVLQPELATEVRSQKMASITRSGAPVVASANPGCSIWLANGGADVRHPIEIVDEVLAAGRARKRKGRA